MLKGKGGTLLFLTSQTLVPILGLGCGLTSCGPKRAIADKGAKHSNCQEGRQDRYVCPVVQTLRGLLRF